MPVRIQELGGSSHERITRCVDDETGLDAIIAIHDTKEGPALGGCRIKSYETTDDHMREAMRLSEAMTHKHIAAGVPCGGGKAVINNDYLTPEMAKSFAVFIDFMNKDGKLYTTGGDLNCGERELEMIARDTRYCYYNPYGLSNSGETTAYGVYTAIKMFADNTHTVNIEGVGKVGENLAKMLKKDGYKIRVADIDKERAMELAAEHDYLYCSLENIRKHEGVYAPCAIGGTIDKDFLVNSRANFIIGGANNQICCPEVAKELELKDTIYVPDYIANMGGVIHIYFDMMKSYAGPTGIKDPDVIAQIKERIEGCPTLRGLKNA